MADADAPEGSSVWPARVLVTGAGGFVGRRLVRALERTPAINAVLPVVGPWAGAQGEGQASVAIDLTDTAAVQRTVDGFAPDVIVHLAAFASVGQGAGQADRVWSANLDGTRAVTAAARRLGETRARPVRLVFASSAEVYGLGFNEGPRAEGSALAPASAYARSKAACEYLLTDLAGGIEVVVLRLFNHTGPGQGEAFVVPALAAQLARVTGEGPGEVRVGNLEARRDFTDIDDIIDAYLAVIRDPVTKAGLEVYNVGSGETRSIQSILDALIQRHGTAVTVIRDPARMRASDVPVAEGVFDRFRARYGWSPTRAFETTIAAILDHEREQAARS